MTPGVVALGWHLWTATKVCRLLPARDTVGRPIIVFHIGVDPYRQSTNFLRTTEILVVLGGLLWPWSLPVLVGGLRRGRLLVVEAVVNHFQHGV